MSDDNRTSAAQRGLGDMDPEEFRTAAHKVADKVADYLGRLEDYRVLPDLQPGEIRKRIPKEPPASPEPIEAVMSDYAELIEPNITHWQHPGFMAYFPSVASGPGILGEWLAAGLNSNVMFWRNAPASTELEERVVQWLRYMLGLPDGFDGMFTDTASISSLQSLVAARHDHADPTRLRLYMSEEAHYSIEKAAMVIGLRRKGVRKVPVDENFAMLPELLKQAIAEDREAGWEPFCVVGTLGTTSSNGIDPSADLAAICREEKLWLHLDAAYGGAAAMVPEKRDLFKGWEMADSIVVNPHKWMFTPFDASLLLFRDPDVYRDAFSIVPEYVKTPVAGGAHDYHEYGIHLGRRFRALKMWMLVRYFGADGMAARIREHIRLAGMLAGWIEREPGWELMAPVPFATLCCRYAPNLPLDEINQVNARIMQQVNDTGRIFLSHTMLSGRYAIRVSIGNPRMTEKHVKLCWDLLRRSAQGMLL